MGRDAFDWEVRSEDRLVSASSERNRAPILEVLRTVFAPDASVLEVASGTGTHAAFFVQHMPRIHWQPSDHDEAGLRSIRAWRLGSDPARFLAPILLDVTAEWPTTKFQGIFCANMIHIAPWACCVALFEGATRVLEQDAPLVLYGPFHDDGPTSEGNANFDRRLRDRDPAWGIREVAAVRNVAAAHGFVLQDRVDMPANNMTLVFVRG